MTVNYYGYLYIGTYNHIYVHAYIKRLLRILKFKKGVGIAIKSKEASSKLVI